MKAATFFTEEEQNAISASIGEVEKQTSGEVAVMVVDESDTYPESRILAGLLIGGLIALGVTDYWFSGSLWTFLPLVTLLSFFFGWAVKFLPSLQRFFIPSNRLEDMVREQALQSFYSKELYKTKDATGVLFFISLFEHRVWVLADKGIYEKISPETLHEYADDIAKGIKEGTAQEALCREIKRAGEILAEHFPISDNDTNELSNKVIIG